MKFIPVEFVYPNEEKDMLSKLEVLFDKWHKHIVEKKDEDISEGVVYDGFFPYYTKQQVKILFI